MVVVRVGYFGIWFFRFYLFSISVLLVVKETKGQTIKRLVCQEAALSESRRQMMGHNRYILCSRGLSDTHNPSLTRCS